MSDEVHIGSGDRLPLLSCPKCAAQLDGVSRISYESRGSYNPKPGDCTVCLYCQALLCFEQSLTSASGLRLRLLTDLELQELQRTQPKEAYLYKLIHEAAVEIGQKRRRKGKG